MTIRCLCVFFLFLTPALCASGLPPGETGERLLRGESVLLNPSSDESGASAQILILVQAPAKAYWDIILSCDEAFVFVDGLELCEVQEDRGDRALVHQVVKKGWPVPTQDFVFESLRDPYREIRFALVEGNLDAMEGRWLFTETEAGLLVDYRVRIKPGVPAPRFLVRRNIRKDMPDLVACIRGLARGSGDMEAAQTDLERCPGDRREPS